MKLHKYESEGHGTYYYFWCPGCKHCHAYVCNAPDGKPNWSFNGNFDKPTFTPSLLIFVTMPDTKERKTCCHLFVTDGKIAYCGDCPHALNGQTVDMVDIPDDYGLPGIDT